MFSKFNTFNLTGNVAAFDLDHTLIVPASGKKFPKSKEDIGWWNEKIPLLLKKLEETAYEIVIFTNQGGIKTGKQTLDEILWRINWVIENAKLKGLSYYISYEKDKYRKPLPGMWSQYKKDRKIVSKGIEINFKKSFYCGDAAGRKSDFSQSDLFFAENCGLQFKTPEEFIGIKIAEPINGEFINWKQYDNFCLTYNFENLIKNIIRIKTPQLILLVGPPGSGKTTFCKQFTNTPISTPEYLIISLDELKLKSGFKRAFNRAIEARQNIILDNTHCKRVNRMEYINMAKIYDYSIVIVNFTTPLNICMHMNIIRKYKEEKELIPFVVYASWKKHHQEIDILEEEVDRYYDYCPSIDDESDIKKIKTNGFESRKLKN